jgi:hypothetical protein
MEKYNKKSDSKPFIPRTPLAEQLWELGQKVLASSIPLLTLDEIRQEVQERRGGVLNEEGLI